MRIHIVARGKIGRGAEAELFDRYLKRLPWPARVTELPDRGGAMPALRSGEIMIALDETGDELKSIAFADRLATWRDVGARELRFVIGGADGLDPGTRDSADFVLSFGKATWPHLLARAMLAEQIWRAASILAGHPYHREG